MYAALFIGLGIFAGALAGHGVYTGTLQVKGGIRRDRFPKAFWFCTVCFAAVGLYLIGLGIEAALLG